MSLFDDIIEILRPPTREEMEKAMGPDHSREGIFVYHNCAYCSDGKKPCVQGGAHRCDNPRARND